MRGFSSSMALSRLLNDTAPVLAEASSTHPKFVEESAAQAAASAVMPAPVSVMTSPGRALCGTTTEALAVAEKSPPCAVHFRAD